MTLSQAAGFLVLLLVIQPCLQNQTYRESVSSFFEMGISSNTTLNEPVCTKASHINAREKRAVPMSSFDYILQVVINTSDPRSLRALVSNLRPPLLVNTSFEITSINTTTVCSPIEEAYQCRCEESYAWSSNHCVNQNACDDIIGGTCGCLSALPADGQYCQPNASGADTTPEPPPLTPADPVDIEIVVDLRFPVSSVSSNFIQMFQDNLTRLSFPQTLTRSLIVIGFNFTTGCFPDSLGGLHCQCEEQFAWSCDRCDIYSACSNATNQTCGCIKGLPSGGEFCEPIANFRACSNTTTTPKPTNSTTVINTTPMTNTTTPNTNFTMASTSPTPTTTTTPTAVSTTISTSTSPTPTTTTTPTAVSTTISTSTSATPTTTTAAPTTTSSNTIIGVGTGLNVEMSVELNRTFNNNLNNKLSDEYKTLESSINKVLVNQYQGFTGFLGVFVTGFREGSVITEFTVQTTKIIGSEVAIANKELISAMKAIAPVIGSVTAVFNSKISINLMNTSPIFTGQTLTLMCNVSERLDIGEISGFIWKFNGNRINTNQVSSSPSGLTSILTVKNVVPLDIGLYECTTTGGIISYSQKRAVTNIEPAPTIRLKRQVNVKCDGGGQVTNITCCVQSTYMVKWISGSENLTSSMYNDPSTKMNCVNYTYPLESCSQPPVFTCKVNNLEYEDKTEITIFTDGVTCRNPLYGDGKEGTISSIDCDPGLEGFRSARCVSKNWTVLEDTCIVPKIKELLFASERLTEETVANFVKNLSTAVRDEQSSILKSPGTISAIIDILKNIATHIGEIVTGDLFQGVLETVDVIIGDDSRQSWATLNANETRNASSSLLGSMEFLAGRLVGEVALQTQRILLNRTSFNNSFRADFNSSISINIPEINLSDVFITTITFSTLNNVMPVRNSSSNESQVVDLAVNAAVVLVKINVTIQNVTLSYSKLNMSLSQGPQCVFWNFTLFNNLGAWDSEGCTFLSDINNTVTCNCNHLTSFSILMATNIPPEIRFALDVITYVGVGISLASLVICLIIEGYVWKAMTKNSTSFMRHVSIVNSAVSLLIANICFIIGASIADNSLENPKGDHLVPVGPCSTATFFGHFFYLALFFWMLVSGLLLFYRTVMVFSHTSKSTMLGIGFALGYGCPLIIAVITVAATAPGKGYIRKEDACWLNWSETKALLAMVIPALTIVSINLLIVFVVVFKMLRRGVGDAAQADEKHTVVVILRCVVILTPLFGLTWALGVGTMITSTNQGIHIAFAFFNSLQGFFILVFGTLFDSRIRSILLKKLPTSSTGSNHTSRITNGGVSSHSGLNWIKRLLRKRKIYHVSEAATSSSTSAAESFINT
ncbi:adhesion G-protein coupled receptor F1-like isoform X2 [Pungitius pungitius]